MFSGISEYDGYHSYHVMLIFKFTNDELIIARQECSLHAMIDTSDIQNNLLVYKNILWHILELRTKLVLATYGLDMVYIRVT